MNRIIRPLIPSLAALALLLTSGCASTGQPRQLASAEPAVLSDAGSSRHTWQPDCSAPPRDDSLEAARCARAQLVQRFGFAVPSLSY